MTPLPEELQGARLRLLWSHPYLGAAVWSVTPVEQKGLGTLAVDRWGRLYYDPDAVRAWTPAEREGVLYHEVSHLLRDHAGRLAGLTDLPLLANLAGDAEINDGLRDEKVPLPAGAIYPDTTFNLPVNLTAEEYLEALRRKVKRVPVAGPCGGKCGSGATGRPEPYEAPAPGSSPNAPDGMGPAEQGVVRKAVAEAVKAAAAQGRGTIPEDLLRWAEDFLKPRVDWRRELRSAVRATLGQAAGAEDYTYRKPHRRSTAVGAVLPSLTRPVPRVAVVVDTSGSMGSDELGRARAEIDGVLRSVGMPIEVVTVDAEVHGKRTVRTRKQVELRGGGGTDMRVGFDAVAASRPLPDVLVFLTDGMTPWPDAAPRGMRTVVCLIGEAGDAPAWAHSVRVPAKG